MVEGDHHLRKLEPKEHANLNQNRNAVCKVGAIWYFNPPTVEINKHMLILTDIYSSMYARPWYSV